MGKPKKKVFRFSKKDYSWIKELEEFYIDIIKKEYQVPGIIDIYKNLEIINKIYKIMIIIRSPLRISIGGGGTDIPSYYEKKGWFFYLSRNK